MNLGEVAPDFVTVAHRIVWCSAATTGPEGPRSRVLHPIWEWDGESLVGWVATAPTPLKRSHLEHQPIVSLNYWDATHDVATADCRATWVLDDEGRTAVWERFASTPPPVGYDPSIIPGWDHPTAEAFAGLRLEPFRLRVVPGSVLAGGEGEAKTWREP